MKLFTYVVVRKPKSKDKNVEPEKPYVLSSIQTIYAENEQQVIMNAGRVLDANIPMDEIEVIVRPF